MMIPLLLSIFFLLKRKKNKIDNKERIDLLRFSYYHNRNKQNPILKKGKNLRWNIPLTSSFKIK